jgi:hypothetical protein
MKIRFVSALFVCAMIALLPVLSLAQDDPSVPAPPRGGTGVVTVTNKLYTVKGEHAGYVSLDYIFKNGRLQGVKPRLVDKAGMPYKVEAVPSLSERGIEDRAKK